MGYLFILGKGLTSIVVLFLLSKLMGRKQVGQMNLFDYIIGITIGSIAAEMTLNDEVNFFEGAFAISIYALVAFFISYLTSKSIVARRLITGSPSVLIQNGTILYQNLKKNKLDINDLLQEARNHGYFDLSQVEYALMEANGKVSFLLKSKYNPATLDDLKIKVPYKGLCRDLVIDGKIMHENLKTMGHDEEWLKKRLHNIRHDNLEDILLVICDSSEKITVFTKNIDEKEEKVLE